MSRSVSGKTRQIVGICAVAILAGCSPLEDRYGYLPEQSSLDDVVVGRDTRDTVRILIGVPGSEGIMDSAGWYYVRSDYRRFLFREPLEVDREVLRVSFDENGVVSNIERFGLQDGRVVVLNRRVTESNIEGVSFLGQLFSNFGRFNAGDFLSEG